MTLRDCLNEVNKLFNKNFGKGNVIANWNLRELRKFTPKELDQLYYSIFEEIPFIEDKEVLGMVKRLRSKIIKLYLEK